jgi:hypothetical protein
MKYAVIIDSYPSSDKDKDLLLKNLKILKSQNIDVLLTSHHPCNSEIIENCDYFLYERENNYYYLDSDIINENISEITNPIYQKYIEIGGYIFYDRCVITGWSVAIISQMINSIKFLWSKGYRYAFYIVEDCIVPNNFKEILENILSEQNLYRNYFIENSNFIPWFYPHFFGFTIDDKLIHKLPKEDISTNKLFQKYFPNCAAEDFMIRIWQEENNKISNSYILENIFGKDNWNIKNSSVTPGSSHLSYTTISSIFVDNSLNNLKLLLFVNEECMSDEINFEINILNEVGDIINRQVINLYKNNWFMLDLSWIFYENSIIRLKKKISSPTIITYNFEDDIYINKKYLNQYSLLKKYTTI